MRAFYVFACTQVLLSLLLLARPGFAKSSGKSGGNLTQEQKQYREVEAKRQQLRSQARQAFDAAMGREQADTCPDAQNTAEFNICFGDAATFADTHLKSYTDALRAILALRYPDQSTTPMTGIAGVEQTPEQEAVEFARLEQLWHEYVTAASTAAFHQLGGGTGGPSFELQTHIRLVHSHLRELDNIYGGVLRL